MITDTTRAPRRWRWVIASALLTAAAAFAVAEAMGWPWLAGPLQQMLSEALARRVVLADGPGFQLRLIGGLRLHAAHIEIDAPDWSATPHLLRAEDLALELRYRDLWRARRGQGLRIQSLSAERLDAHLERLSDGRTSWPAGPQADASRPALPAFGNLQLGTGTLTYRDEPLAINVQARVSWIGAETPDERALALTSGVLRLDASGQVRRLPLKLELVASGVVPAGHEPIGPIPLRLTASLGRTELNFTGTAADALHLDGLAGRYRLKGPSLAAVGDWVGVTLPTTAAFQTEGTVHRDAQNWRVVVDAATIGASRLNGDFVYDGSGRVPLLSGRLGGARLLLADLGPVLGTTPAVAAASVAAPAASAPLVVLAAAPRGAGKVLPNRPFDLPALRAMDANVLIDIDSVDLNTALLEPLRPLRGHLQLHDGVLNVRNLDARTAQGRLGGELALDGRAAKALWKADLRWSDVRLEHWIRQPRANAAPPFVSGRLDGRATLAGQGRSTAEILASLHGQARTALRGGAISHLAIEAAGVDLAQSLGVLLRGDDALPVTCAAADLVAENGIFRARTMVVDTTDSTVWLTGSVSLADEALDLRAVVSPKDFSPLALRTPLRVRGSLAQPQVSLEKTAVGGRVAGALLLGLIQPLAALLPLLDPGSAEAAARGGNECRKLIQRSEVARASK